MSTRILTVIAALTLCATASADPLLTKSQITKAAREIEACIAKQGEAQAAIPHHHVVFWIHVQTEEYRIPCIERDRIPILLR